MKIVKIDWIDSTSRNGWQDKEKHQVLKDLSCVSVGIEIHRDKKSIVIVQSTSEDQFAEELTIPMSAVSKITELNKNIENK